MWFYQQFFCDVKFCFEKEVNLFIETIRRVIQEILIYLLTASNNYSTCFYMS